MAARLFFSDAMTRQDTDEGWRLLSAAAKSTLCAAGLDAAGVASRTDPLAPQPRSVSLTRSTPAWKRISWCPGFAPFEPQASDPGGRASQ